MNDVDPGAALYQPLDPATLSDPFPVYRKLQTNAPIFWHAGLFAWVLSGYSDCRRVLQDPALFTRDRQKLGRPMSSDEMTIQTFDPPEQLPLRHAILQALRRTDSLGACHNAMAQVEQLLRGQSVGRAFDFMEKIAAPVAVYFASKLIGVTHMTPESYRSIFLRLSRAMDREVYAQCRDEGVQASHELNAIIERARREAPSRSMIHELDLVPQVSEMSLAYVRNTVSAAFNAAFSTAYSSMGSFLLLCLQRPELPFKLQNAEDLHRSINELLRFLSPAQMTARFATCDVEISGTLIRQNDPVVTLMAAANRDPRVFDNPDDVVLDRAPNPHLSFGHGPHFCVGARPAEEFLIYFLDRLRHWAPEVMLAAPPLWLNTATLRCLDRLDVALTSDRGI